MQKSKDFHPSVWECHEALDVFLQAFQHHYMDCSREVAFRCGLDAVWEAARRHQVQLEAADRKSPQQLKAADQQTMNSVSDVIEVAV